MRFERAVGGAESSRDLASATRLLPGAQGRVWIIAAVGVALIAALAAHHGGWRLGIGALLGAFGGFSLYHASFGFASAWRTFIRTGRGGGVRAQLLLIALVVLAAYPLIGWSEALGLNIGGYVFPFGVAAAFGAFLFGAGMQLGGGCGSGTLYTVGGGSSRMALTLAAFIAGSVLATAHWDVWQALPAPPPLSLIWSAGPVLAMLIALAVLATLFLASLKLEGKLHGGLAPETRTGSLLQGPWSLTAGAAALAIMSVLTLIVLGRPWGITSAFALWGAKIAQGAGINAASWPYWNHSPALDASVFADATSVQDFGLILGAMMAAGLAGKFAPVWRLPLRPAMAAIIGGLMMGYGARLSFGCNIGAFLGGIVSGSLHGLGWLVFGLMGSALGARLRPLFGLN